MVLSPSQADGAACIYKDPQQDTVHNYSRPNFDRSFTDYPSTGTSQARAYSFCQFSQHEFQQFIYKAEKQCLDILR